MSETTFKKSDNVDKEFPLLITILFMASQAKDTNAIAIDNEFKQIEQIIQESGNKDIRLFSAWAVSIADLQESLLRYSPTIVSISSHGLKDGIAFEDSNNNYRIVDAEVLGRLFKFLKGDIKCVILNACLTENTAVEISKHIDYVIGITTEIKDESAIAFSTAFFRAIAFGKDIETAYNLGVLQLDIEKLSDSSKIILHKMVLQALDEDVINNNFVERNLNVW